MHENMEAASTTYLDDLWWWNTLKEEALTLHTWLLHKSPSVGEDGESPKFHTHQKQSCLKNDVSSTLLKKEN